MTKSACESKDVSVFYEPERSCGSVNQPQNDKF